MNFICLSLAPNLRCQDLSKIQSIIIFVPAAIEAVFSLVLALADSSLRGRKRWVLVCDGLSFFVLALLDFLAHRIPGISTSQEAFSVIDSVIAAASFIPLFAYLLFLFIFAKSNLIKSIPSRFRGVLTNSLFLIIPPTVVFNELGSLLGISHESLVTPGKPSILAAALFTLSFVRIVRAFIDERRVEDHRNLSSEPAEKIHLFRGIGWLSAGLKLGAIESVVGFADTSFAVVLTRRTLRLFGRGAVIIGVIKGLNIVEDFVQFETDVQTRRSESTRTNRRSRETTIPVSRIVISNPRTSTFHQLSPNASSFHAAQAEKRTRKPSPSPLILGINSSFNKFNNQDGEATSMPQRVTVHWDGKAAPVLDVRFSRLDFSVSPIPLNRTLSAIKEEYNRRFVETPERRMTSPDRSTLTSNGSMNRRASDSLSEAVRDLASHFPNLPPLALTPTTASTKPSIPRYDWHCPSRVSSRGSLRSEWENLLNTERPMINIVSAKPVTNSNHLHNVVEKVHSRFSVSTFWDDQDRNSPEFYNNMQIDQSPLVTPVLSSSTVTTTSTPGSPIHPILSKHSTFGGEWPDGGVGGQYDTPLRRTQLSSGNDAAEIVNDAWERAGLTRVKSVAPAQTTPPVKMSPMRRSMVIMGLPPSFETNTSALKKPVQLSSTILGEEGGRLIHKSGYF